MEISPQSIALIEKLSDGEFHSGEILGRQVGVSRAAIWKTLQSFSDLGLSISRVRGKGYCLQGGLNLMNVALIKESLPQSAKDQLDDIVVLPCVDSTNMYLLQIINTGRLTRYHKVCLSEMQTQGRGRRGRKWQSPFGRNIYLSLCWPFESGAASFEGLSLAVGVIVAQTLERVAQASVSLKWPNDILFEEAKLGGVLIEIAGDALGLCHAVIGIGLNVDSPAGAMASVDQPWTDLKRSTGCLLARNTLASGLIEGLVNLSSSYEKTGFAPFVERWEALNAHADQQVFLSTPMGTIGGVAEGVSGSGALRLKVDGVEKSFVGGELSLRASE